MSTESFEKWASEAEEMQLSNPARTQFAKLVWQASRAVALEDAAKVCDKFADKMLSTHGDDMAKLIRAMKGE